MFSIIQYLIHLILFLSEPNQPLHIIMHQNRLRYLH